MLKSVGSVIRSQLRDYDFLARYGGDEFVAIVPDMDNSDIIELCRRIESAVDDFSIEISKDVTAKVGVSIGTASFPAAGESFDQLIVAADKAMYSTKAFHKARSARLAELNQSDVPIPVPAKPLPPIEEEVIDAEIFCEAYVIDPDDVMNLTSTAVN